MSGRRSSSITQACFDIYDPCVSIAPVLLSVPLALAQNVPPTGTSSSSANLPQTAVPNPAEGYYSGTLAGTAVQYSPYKNPYQISITFTGPRCDFGNDTATGLMTVSESPGQAGNFSIGIVGTNINRDKLLSIYLAKESVSIAAPPQPPSPSPSTSPSPPPPPSTGGSVIDGGYLLE